MSLFLILSVWFSFAHLVSCWETSVSVWCQWHWIQSGWSVSGCFWKSLLFSISSLLPPNVVVNPLEINRINSGNLACSYVYGQVEPAHCWHEVMAHRYHPLSSVAGGVSRLISFVQVAFMRFKGCIVCPTDPWTSSASLLQLRCLCVTCDLAPSICLKGSRQLLRATRRWHNNLICLMSTCPHGLMQRNM